jgi:hypothetical protein
MRIAVVGTGGIGGPYGGFVRDSPLERKGFELVVPPCERSEPSSLAAVSAWVGRDGRRENQARGTEGSNPLPSSAESGMHRRPRVKRPFWIVTRAGAVEIDDEVFFEIGGTRFSTSRPPLAR